MRALLVAAALLGATPALAARPGGGLDHVNLPQRWALGFTLGDPFGISLKRYLGGANAWDAYVAFAYGPGLRFGGDYLWGLGRLVHQPKFDLDLYLGAGPFVGILSGPCGPGFIYNRCNGDGYFGGRVPLGIEMLLREAPLTLGLEIAPGIAFAPGGPFGMVDFVFALRFLL